MLRGTRIAAAVWCSGRLIAGWPVTLPNAVKATLATTSATGASGFACASASTFPAGGGRIAEVGVTSTSKSLPQRVTSRRLSSSWKLWDDGCRDGSARPAQPSTA